MRYAMKQKIFCLGDDYRVLDDEGNEVYLIDGAAFPILGNKLRILDRDGVCVAQIRQRLLSWGPCYDVVRDGATVATVSKHLFTLFLCKFTVDVPGPDDLEASGNLFDYEYHFVRGGRTVARVLRQFFAWSDTYGVDIDPGEDDVLILAATVVIDLCCHTEREK